MTPLIGLILSAITAAISAAPQTVSVVQAGKDMISALFSAGLIDKPLQDRLFAHVDAHAEAVSNGNIPPGWEVDPDPE